MTEINKEMVFSPSKNAAFRIIANETVIVDTSSNRMITLNDTGTFIWSHLQGNNIEKIAEFLHSDFEVKEEIALRDVKVFLFELFNRGLVVLENPNDSVK